MHAPAENPGQQSTCFGQTLGKADFARRPMSLAKFLEPFDHRSLTDYDAGSKYAAYKASFAKQQLEDFFERNKNQAWFREKYHPDVMQDPSIRRKLCERRLEVFMEMYNSDLLASLKLDTSNDTRIAKLLDLFAIKLAGGTDEDIRFFEDFKPPEVKSKANEPTFPTPSVAKSQADQPSNMPKTVSVVTDEKKIHTSKEARKKLHKKSSPTSGGRRQKRAHSSSGSSHSDSDHSSDSESDSGSSRKSGATSGSDSDSGDDSSNSSSSSGSSSAEDGSSSGSSSGSESSESDDHSASSGSDGEKVKRKEKHCNKAKSKPTKRSGHKRSASVSSTDSKNTASKRTDEAMDMSDGVSCGLPRGSADVGNSNEVLPEKIELVHRLPIHFNRVLYFPHIPLNIYQKDMIALLSTSPHFLRLAILDPIILPSSDQQKSSHSEPFFQIADSTPTIGISLRRVGWATFAAQTYEGDSLVNVDVAAICSKLLQQATEAQAPESMLECLRSAKVLPDQFNRPLAHRVRWKSHFMKNLLDQGPNQLYSKALLRRHLVLAARLADELDKASGLWNDEQTSVNGGAQGAPMDTQQPQIDDEKAASEDNQSISDKSSDEEESNMRHKPAVIKPALLPIDPGDDLVEAATILGRVVSKNPLLRGLTDYLVDEGNAEEELLLSGGFQSISFGQQPTSAPMSTVSSILPASDDTEMLQVLDRLILYMRLVHSVDFYAPAKYASEDAMPHPCQLIHVRPSKIDVTKAVAKRISPKQGEKVPDHDASFSNQLKRLVRLIRPLTPEDCVCIGYRDVEEVIDNFIKANTRRKRRKTDVIWVCLLSDKKFRDPIYVKKHIMNKHMEKVEAVKKDSALFFNNYILDPMRPQFPLEPHLPKKKQRSISPVSKKPVKRQKESRERSFSGPTDSQRWPQPRRYDEDFRPVTRPFPQRRDYQVPPNISRPYDRMPFFQPRFPFQQYRSRMTGPPGPGYQQNRRGNIRRPYVDLDAV